MGNEEITWIVGALVCFVLVISAVIPTAISLTSTFNSPGTQTGELWTGTAGVAHPVTYNPVVSVVAFKNKTAYSQYNDTKIAGANGATTLKVDSYAAHGGNTWDNVTIQFTIAGINATNNVTWVAGTCNAANKTWTTSPQTYTDINSSCLTPGSTLTFTFTNKTLSEENMVNVTNITMNYSRYTDSTEYTLASASGQFTPTNSGYYYTSYTYGTATTGSTGSIMLLLPLVIAAVLLVIFMRSSGVF